MRSATYQVNFESPVPALEQRVCALLARASIPRLLQRKRRQVEKDLRPLIYDLVAADPQTLHMNVAVGDRGNLRPQDLLAELGLHEHWHRIHRRQLLLAGAEELTCN